MSSHTKPTLTHQTPIGQLTLAASDAGLTRVRFRRPGAPAVPDGAPSSAAWGWLELARRELDEYFAGTRREFHVPVDFSRVEPRHRRVLEHLSARVGYGQTTTYGDTADALGMTEDGPRQVGAAMAGNPVLIIVACHRMLGAGGRLTGYAGGLAAKRWLLDFESRDHAPQLALVLTAGTAPHHPSENK